MAPGNIIRLLQFLFFMLVTVTFDYIFGVPGNLQSKLHRINAFGDDACVSRMFPRSVIYNLLKNC